MDFYDDEDEIMPTGLLFLQLESRCLLSFKEIADFMQVEYRS